MTKKYTDSQLIEKIYNIIKTDSVIYAYFTGFTIKSNEKQKLSGGLIHFHWTSCGFTERIIGFYYGMSPTPGEHPNNSYFDHYFLCDYGRTWAFTEEEL